MDRLIATRRAARCVTSAFAFAASLFCSRGDALVYASAGELRDDCAAVPAMLRGERAALSAAGECIAFIDGARTMAQIIADEQRRTPWCIPENLGDPELAAIYVEAIDRNPRRRADPAAATLYATLANAFPCGA